MTLCWNVQDPRKDHRQSNHGDEAKGRFLATDALQDVRNRSLLARECAKVIREPSDADSIQPGIRQVRVGAVVSI